MKRPIHVLLCLIWCTAAWTQNARHKIALFTPAYLDSAFDAAGNFRYEKTGARFVTPGLDFYYGAQLALDSLQKRGAALDVYIYDSRGREPLAQQLSRPELRDVEMIIAQSSLPETRILAQAAQRKKVPFISATLPNDAGVNANPYFVVLNSTLQTHIEGIYHFLQKYHSLDRIVVFRKRGGQEDMILKFFNDYSKTTASGALPIRFVDLPENFTAASLAAQLDSTKKNVCIAGSMDDAFGSRLTQMLAGINQTYPIRVIGMPTWDNMNFNRVQGLEIIYTSPFYYSPGTPLESALTTEYTALMNSHPTDLFFRGYETVLRFGTLLLDTGKDVSSSLTRKGSNAITQFDIQPVFKDHSTMTLDYFENKHLYFIKVFGGAKNLIN